MGISKEVKKKLVQELRYCADKMSKERDLRKKQFFFSNTINAIAGAIDFEYDSQLVLVELVLDVSSSTIANRIEQNLSGKDTSVELIEGLFDGLFDYLNELALNIEESQDTYKTLEKIAELAHTTTERGYYLYTKGYVKP